MKLSFQISHTPVANTRIHHTIESILNSIKDTHYDVELIPFACDFADDTFIEFDYTHKGNHIGLTGFSIQLHAYSDAFVSDLLDALRQDDAIQWVGKFYDGHMKARYAKHAQEIFDIEMQLREVLTFIFLNRYPDAPYDLLSEFKHSPKSKRVHSKADESKGENTLKPLYENDFFHLLFSDYVKLNHHALKRIDHEDVITAITSSKSFEDFQTRLTSRGIQDKSHQDFISAIKASLQSIETFRNCIAHNRAHCVTEYENYEKSLKHLKQEIQSFWRMVNDAKPAHWLWNEEAREAVQRALEHAEIGPDSITIGHNGEEHSVQSYDELFQLLCTIAQEEAANYMPSDSESREMAEDTFSPELEVENVLPFFEKELHALGWQ